MRWFKTWFDVREIREATTVNGIQEMSDFIFWIKPNFG